MPPKAQRYRNIGIDGPVHVQPLAPSDLKGIDVFLIILMGATGAGKSAFIQALSPKQDLHISKNTLESVTQEINLYKLVNVTNQRAVAPYILMDTPGFLDTTLSESRITRMITDKLNTLRGITQDLWVSVYYFHPITDIRLSGSKRHSIALLKSFAESYIAASINVVTTMWNTLLTPKQLEDATKRYRSLELEVFTKSSSLDVILSKFKCTKKTALSVLDTTWRGWHHNVDKVQDVNRYPHYHALTLSNSLSRITNTQQQLLFLAEDKASTLASGSNLTSKRVLKVLDKKEKATREVLQAFIYDLYEFDQSAYRSAFPDLPFPPVRLQGSSSTHLKTHFKWLVAPVKWALRMEK
ncbi:hypothetical protein BJ165DRAFT_1616429 [Panaeolus papilionaceus]|nr:hypothetical protein BJ165DRAFT_1616429 [Panaeolus papilionaceus]